MTIEFNCPNCRKNLTVTDDKTGLQTKCPGCRSFCSVPDPRGESKAGVWDVDEPLFEEDDFLLGEMVTCPVCGQLMDSYLGSCQACENQEAIREFENDSSDEIPNLVWKSGKVRVTAVLSRSCRLYKNYLGSCIFACFLSGGLTYAATQSVFYLFALILAGGFWGAAATESMALMIVTVLLIPGGIALMFFISSLMLCYFLLGLQAFYLRVVQGQSAGFRDVFNVGSCFWRMYFCTFVLSFFLLIGSAFLMVPGLILLFCYWPYAFLLVDRNLPGISSLSEAPMLLKGNWIPLMIIFLPLLGLAYAGMQSRQLISGFCEQVLYLTVDQSVYLSFGLTGIVATLAISFGMLVLAVTYAEMTGQ